MRFRLFSAELVKMKLKNNQVYRKDGEYTQKQFHEKLMKLNPS